MRALFVFITLFLLSQASAWGQVVVGTYHLAATDKDYVILVDDMQNRYKGKMPNKELKRCQIYLQVESSTPGIEAYIKLSNGDAKNFAKVLTKYMSKAKEYTMLKSSFSKKEGGSDVELYMKRHNETTDAYVYGYESGQDYDIYIGRNESGRLYLSYNGDPARSEGDDGLSISGWQLDLTSDEEIQAIDALLQKAIAMIKSNSLTPTK